MDGDDYTWDPGFGDARRRADPPAAGKAMPQPALTAAFQHWMDVQEACRLWELYHGPGTVPQWLKTELAAAEQAATKKGE